MDNVLRVQDPLRSVIKSHGETAIGRNSARARFESVTGSRFDADTAVVFALGQLSESSDDPLRVLDLPPPLEPRDYPRCHVLLLEVVLSKPCGACAYRLRQRAQRLVDVDADPSHEVFRLSSAKTSLAKNSTEFATVLVQVVRPSKSNVRAADLVECLGRGDGCQVWQQGDRIGWARLQNDTQVEAATIGFPATTETTTPGTLLFGEDEAAMRGAAARVLECDVVRRAGLLDRQDEATPPNACATKAFA